MCVFSNICQLMNVLNALINRINSVIGIGVGAGAYILTRLAVSKISSILFCYNDQLV